MKFIIFCNSDDLSYQYYLNRYKNSNKYVNILSIFNDIKNNIFLSDFDKNRITEILIKNQSIRIIFLRFMSLLKNNLIHKKKSVNNCDLYLEKFTNSSPCLKIAIEGVVYRFSPLEIKRIFTEAILQNDYEYSSPRNPINPYTNKRLPYETIIKMYLFYKEHLPANKYIEIFKTCDFKIGKLNVIFGNFLARECTKKLLYDISDKEVIHNYISICNDLEIYPISEKINHCKDFSHIKHIIFLYYTNEDKDYIVDLIYKDKKKYFVRDIRVELNSFFIFQPYELQ